MSGTFRYIKIPADAAKPLEQLSASKSGGLSNDALVEGAKDYFSKLYPSAPVATTEGAVDDKQQAFLQMMQQASSPCEITALTVPTKGNQYRAVSMYSSSRSSSNSETLLNERATQLLLAAGHALPKDSDGIHGDVFVGRAHDDEAVDWERLDFTAEDVAPTADWIKIAAQPGGGGGGGRSTATSLSGLLQQQATVAQQHGTSAGGGTTAPQSTLKYTWTQTDDEVEIKFQVGAHVQAKKHVQIKFQPARLKVVVDGEVLADSATGGRIVVDESTFTLQDAGDGRELCITLTKQSEQTVWPQAISTG